MGRLAAEYGLHPLYKREFHDVFDEFREIPEFKDLLTRMKVVDRNEERCQGNRPITAKRRAHG